MRHSFLDNIIFFKSWLKNQFFRPLSINKYWGKLSFDYLTTYSGLSSGEYKLIVDENSFVDPSSYSIFYQGKFHKSAKEINSYQKNSSFLIELGSILSIKFKEESILWCAPIYRDAIVFYSDKGKIISVLQICFSCNHLMNEEGKRIKADDQVYSKLRELMKNHGHLIEN